MISQVLFYGNTFIVLNKATVGSSKD